MLDCFLNNLFILINNTSKQHISRSFWWKSTGDRWISPEQGPVQWNAVPCHGLKFVWCYSLILVAEPRSFWRNSLFAQQQKGSPKRSITGSLCDESTSDQSISSQKASDATSGSMSWRHNLLELFSLFSGPNSRILPKRGAASHVLDEWSHCHGIGYIRTNAAGAMCGGWPWLYRLLHRCLGPRWSMVFWFKVMSHQCAKYGSRSDQTMLPGAEDVPRCWIYLCQRSVNRKWARGLTTTKCCYDTILTTNVS